MMAYYLVEAAAKEERLPELGERLENEEFLSMRPFGVSVTFSLRGAPTAKWCGKKRTIVHHRSPRNARPYSTSTLTTFVSHRSKRMRGGLRSVICRHSFPSWRISA